MKDGLIFYISQYEAIKSLTNEQLGRLYRAIFEKQLGNEVVLEDDIKIAFNFINNQMVVDNKKYLKKVETLRNNGLKGGAPIGNQNAKKDKNNQNNQIEKKTTLNEKEKENVNVKDNKKENIKRKSFLKPSLDEIKNYCLERNNGVEAEKFYDFYESKGWMVGKNKMTDWKASVRTWERRNPKKADVPSWFNQDLSKKEVEMTEEEKRIYEYITSGN